MMALQVAHEARPWAPVEPGLLQQAVVSPARQWNPTVSSFTPSAACHPTIGAVNSPVDDPATVLGKLCIKDSKHILHKQAMGLAAPTLPVASAEKQKPNGAAMIEEAPSQYKKMDFIPGANGTAHDTAVAVAAKGNATQKANGDIRREDYLGGTSNLLVAALICWILC